MPATSGSCDRLAVAREGGGAAGGAALDELERNQRGDRDREHQPAAQRIAERFARERSEDARRGGRHPRTQRTKASSRLSPGRSSVVERAVRRDASLVQDRDVIAGALDLREHVRAHEHARAARARSEDPVARVAHPDRIEARGGLVEQQQRGLAEQGLREADALRETFREATEPIAAAAGEAGALEHGVDLVRKAAPARPASVPCRRKKAVHVMRAGSTRRSGR